MLLDLARVEGLQTVGLNLESFIKLANMLDIVLNGLGSLLFESKDTTCEVQCSLC